MPLDQKFVQRISLRIAHKDSVSFKDVHCSVQSRRQCVHPASADKFTHNSQTNHRFANSLRLLCYRGRKFEADCDIVEDQCSWIGKECVPFAGCDAYTSKTACSKDKKCTFEGGNCLKALIPTPLGEKICDACGGYPIIRDNEAGIVSCVKREGLKEVALKNVFSRKMCTDLGGIPGETTSCGWLEDFVNKGLYSARDIITDKRERTLACSIVRGAMVLGGDKCCGTGKKTIASRKCDVCAKSEKFDPDAVGGFVCEGVEPSFVLGHEFPALRAAEYDDKKKCMDAGGTPRDVTCGEIEPLIKYPFDQGTCAELAATFGWRCCGRKPKCPICGEGKSILEDNIAFSEGCKVDGKMRPDILNRAKCSQAGGTTERDWTCADFRFYLESLMQDEQKTDAEKSRTCSFHRSNSLLGGGKCCASGELAPRCDVCAKAGGVFMPTNEAGLSCKNSLGVDIDASTEKDCWSKGGTPKTLLCSDVKPYMSHASAGPMCAAAQNEYGDKCCSKKAPFECPMCGANNKMTNVNEAFIEECLDVEGKQILLDGEPLHFRDECIEAGGTPGTLYTCEEGQYFVEFLLQTAYKDSSELERIGHCSVYRSYVDKTRSCCAKPIETCDVCSGGGVYNVNGVVSFKCISKDTGEEIMAENRIDCALQKGGSFMTKPAEMFSATSNSLTRKLVLL